MAVMSAGERVGYTEADETMRMDAYYYGFDRTGVAIVDRILSAVAVAGKGSHNTDGWADEAMRAYYDDGLTHEERIQYAADAAAATIRERGQQ
jgi:hypothetical protein